MSKPAELAAPTGTASSSRGRHPGRLMVDGLLRRATIAAALRWLILLIALAGVLATSYQALTHRRMDRSNGITGELLRGTNIGQSFVSRYDRLSGIEVLIGTYGRGASPTKASFVMHLRSSPGSGPDVTIATLPPQQVIGENSWYTFSFAPIAGSQDKMYYVEIESPDGQAGNALTLYWWESNPTTPTDPYPQGSAYRNGKLQAGDLAFGLHYSPSPIAAWTQMSRAASASLPSAFAAILLLLGAAVAYVALRTPALLRQPNGIKWLKRWSLPFVLGVAMLNGILFLFIIPPWQGWDEQGHFTALALLDKHDLDYQAVKNLQWWEGGKDREEILQLKHVTWASMQRNNWSRLVTGYPVPGSTAPPLMNEPAFTDFTFELQQPPSYYWLCAVTLRAARLVGFSADPYADPEGALRWMRGVSVALNLGVVALAWLASTLLTSRRDSWLRLLLPLTIALLPMHTYIAASADNDIIGEFAVSALFFALVALLKWPVGWRGVGLASLVVALTLACTAAKSTAFVAGAPLAGLGLAVWIGMMASRSINRVLEHHQQMNNQFSEGSLQNQNPDIQNPQRWTVALPASLVLIFLLLCSAATWLVFEPGNTTAGWQTGGPSNRAAQRQVQDAHDGAYVMELQPGQTAFQWVDFPLPHPPFSMTLSLWARSSTGVSPAQALLLVDQRGRLPRIGAETLSSVERRFPLTTTVAGAWMPFTFTVPVKSDDRKVLVRLAAGDQAAQFDSLSLSGRVSQPSTGEAPQIKLNLFNPSAEIGSIALRPTIQRLLPGEQVDIIDLQANPQPFDKLTIARRFAYRQFRSFWGNFGWVSLPLPEILFTLINIIIGLSLIGLVVRAVLHIGRWTRGEWLGLVSLIALVIAIIVGFARQMAPINTAGVYADPHGRYLFVLMIPIVWLLLAGLRDFGFWSLGVVGRIVRPKSENVSTAAKPEQESHVPWAVWAWSNAVALFTFYCLISLIGPYYYG